MAVPGQTWRQTTRKIWALLLQSLPTRLNGSSGVGWRSAAFLHPQDVGKASSRSWGHSEDRMGPYGQKAFGRQAYHLAHRCCQVLQSQGQGRPSRKCSPLQEADESEREIHMASSYLRSHCSPQVPKDWRKMRVKAGTQVIDRAWRFLKDRIHAQSNSKVGFATLKAQIRSAQYEYWHMGQDLWKLTGSVRL